MLSVETVSITFMLNDAADLLAYCHCRVKCTLQQAQVQEREYTN